MMASFLDETGGVVTSKFDEWVAPEQKTRAHILKSTRQFQEERNAEHKHQSDKGGGEPGKKDKK